MKRIWKALRWKEEKEQQAVKVSLLFWGFGLAVVLISKRVFDITGDSVYLALLFLPILLYLVLSGKIEQLKGPGGWEVKFTKLANEPVETAVAMEKIQVEADMDIAKRTLGNLPSQLLQVSKFQKVVLTVALGGDYEPTIILEYLNVLSSYPNFKYVIFQDSFKRFVAFIPAAQFERMVRNPVQGMILEEIKGGQLPALMKYPAVFKDCITIHATNAEALRRMAELHLSAIAVVDDDFQWKCMVERDQVLSRMLLGLSPDRSPANRIPAGEAGELNP